MNEPENIRSTSLELRGYKWMMFKLAEECCELSAIILQHYNKDSTTETDILKEVADVEIAIEIVKDIYGTDQIEEFKREKYKKINTANIELMQKLGML